MSTDIGEFIVGAYLKVKEECDFVDYNVRIPGGGQKGLNEIDVVGLNFKKKKAYICEVTTHIHGVRYGSYDETFNKIKAKFAHQRDYANRYLQSFKNKEHMFWSPIVPVGKLTKRLNEIKGLQLIINTEYTKRIDELKIEAQNSSHQIGNPFFRTLQILECLRRGGSGGGGEHTT